MRELFRFRSAAPSTASWNVAKTLMQTSLFWFVFLVAIPWLVIQIEPKETGGWWAQAAPAVTWVGVVLFVMFSCLGLSSGVVMATMGEGTPLPIDCPIKLVARGPYARVRNPMAIAGIGQGVSVGLALGSPAVIVYARAGAILWHVIIRPAEERDLEKRFGAEYARYRQCVPLWLPRWKPFDPTQTP